MFLSTQVSSFRGALFAEILRINMRVLFEAAQHVASRSVHKTLRRHSELYHRYDKILLHFTRTSEFLRLFFIFLISSAVIRNKMEKYKYFYAFQCTLQYLVLYANYLSSILKTHLRKAGSQFTDMVSISISPPYYMQVHFNKMLTLAITYRRNEQMRFALSSFLLMVK